MRIRDLIYFDNDKASSIWSQIKSGLPESESITTERKIESKMSGSTNAVIVRADGTHSVADREMRQGYSRVYHDLLTNLEEALENGQLVTDINELELNDGGVDSARGKLLNQPYVRAVGHVVFEDYAMLKRISANFRGISNFLVRCSSLEGKQSEEVQKILDGIDKCCREIALAVDHKEEAKIRKKMAETQLLLDKATETSLNTNPEWLLMGIAEWIEMFAPQRRTLRLTSGSGDSQIQFVGNLKTDNFVDQNLDHVLFSYGHRPNVQLTLFGLVTNIPLADNDSDNMESVDLLGDDADMINAFEGIFESLNGVYQIMNPIKYPRIAIHPIALYRDIQFHKDG